MDGLILARTTRQHAKSSTCAGGVARVRRGVTIATGRKDVRTAGLRYSSDEAGGISRRRSGTGFSYRSARGARIRSERTLARIRSLAIPPAWEDVWISSDAQGHLQATGRDARGRKQYLYHPAWRSVRDASKFDRMLAFGTALPALRERIEADLAREGLPRERVLAAVVRLVDDTLIRVGSEEYRRSNGSFGASTMRQSQAHVDGRRITIDFRGKGGKLQHAEITDGRLARIVQRLQELPGRELFEYLDDDGERRRVRSDDVNSYLQEIAGDDLSIKDFRTWGASALCLGALCEADPPASQREAKQSIAAAIEEVAATLGNTPAVCRSSYVHPALLEAFGDGDLPCGSQRRLHGLGKRESRLLRFLRARS